MTGRHSGAKTINNGFWGWLFVPVLLAGCLEDTNSTQSPGFATGGVSTATSWNADSPRTKVASDEELAPNVFSVQDDGIWDGRPSLGGVWVSHEDATTPERVLVTDPATGKSVVAALFRRLPGQAGPSVRGTSNPDKGFPYLRIALDLLSKQRQDVDLVILAPRMFQTVFPCASK